MQHNNTAKPLLPSIKFLLDGSNEHGGAVGNPATSSPSAQPETSVYVREYHVGHQQQQQQQQQQQHSQHYPFPAGPGAIHKDLPSRLDGNPRAPLPMHPRQYHQPATSVANLPVDMQGLSISGPPKYNMYEHQQEESNYSAGMPFGRHMDMPGHPAPNSMSPAPGYGQNAYGSSVPNLREPNLYHFPPHPHAHARPANLSPPPVHLYPGRPNRHHSHSRSLSDFTHPYASSPPRDPTFLNTVHPHPHPHPHTHTHRRAASANTIDFLLQQPAPWASPNDSPRIPSPIPSSAASTTSTAPTSPIDDNDYDELSEERSLSERSASPDGSSGGSGNANGAQNRYQCPFCAKRFSRPSSLRIHTYSHTGEKPFVCTEDGCGRKFSVQSNMRRHLRVHRLGRTVKKVRYDGEVEGVKMVGASGSSGGNSPSDATTVVSSGSGLHRAGTI